MKKSDNIFDIKHIWHPYSSMINPLPCYPVISAKGSYLKLNNGQKLIDGMSSWWAVIHGYNNIQLNEAMTFQINQISHVMFAGITHPSAIKLCRKLIHITPKNLKCVFLADSGSISIEIAIKMILQYWHVLGKKKSKFLTIKKGYHGDTFFATSVCDPKNSSHYIYNNLLPKNLFADAPKCSFHEKWNDNDIKSFESIIEQYSSTIAGVIMEPIVQGAGGMRFYHPKYLKTVRTLCTKYKIPLILDEIATGFGRTGKMFACEHANVQPDILCVGKALTGGTINLAATLTTKKIANVISQSETGCFMYGPTFMGNPLSCAAANASIKLLKTNQWKKQVSNIETILCKNLFKLKEHDRVFNVRVLGAIGVVECHNFINLSKIQQFFVKNNVWIRPFKKLIYLMPAYTIHKYQLEKIIHVISKALDNKNFFI